MSSNQQGSIIQLQQIESASTKMERSTDTDSEASASLGARFREQRDAPSGKLPERQTHRPHLRITNKPSTLLAVLFPQRQATAATSRRKRAVAFGRIFEAWALRMPVPLCHFSRIKWPDSQLMIRRCSWSVLSRCVFSAQLNEANTNSPVLSSLLADFQMSPKIERS